MKENDGDVYHTIMKLSKKNFKGKMFQDIYFLLKGWN